MTVPATVRRAGPFLGNGAATTFPFTFKVTDADEVQVVLLSGGAETQLVKDSDYTITLNADQDATPGGAVTFPVSGDPLTATESLTIAGDIPYSQDADLPTGGAYSAVVVENALDRAVMQIQQLAEENDRSVRMPLSAASADAVLPVPQSNALLGWNEAANALQNVDPGLLATLAAYGTAVADVFTGDGTTAAVTLTASPGVLANLDVSIGGVTQTPGVDFTWSTGTTLTFSEAPPSGETVVVRYMRALPQGYTDSSASTFVQSGTGAVERSVQDELRRRVHVKQFGGYCDLVHDDTAAFSAALVVAGMIGADVEFDWPGCLISQGLMVRVTAPVGGTYSWEQLHFAPVPTVSIIGKGRPTLRATQAMGAMITYQYNSGLSNPAPYWSCIENVHLDGGGVASIGIKTDYMMHNSARRVGISNLAADGIGIYYAPGYGVHRVEDCAIWAQTCIKVDHAGDTHIEKTDLWPKAIGVDVAPYGGDMHLEGCVFNRDTETGTLIGVRLSGDYATSAGEHVRHVRIQSSEFAGMDIGVYGVRGTYNKNLFALTFSNNHPKANGTPTANADMVLVELHGATDVLIEHNQINNLGQGAGNYAVGLDVPVKLYDCDRVGVLGNTFAGYAGPAVYLNNCTQGRIGNNGFYDIGQSGSSQVIVDLDNSTDWLISNNDVAQSSASYAQTFVQERTGSDRNRANSNALKGIAASSAFGRVGTSSVFDGTPLRASATYDPPSLASGSGTSTNITVTGARVGDAVTAVSFTQTLLGIQMTAEVSSANTVTVRLHNQTGGTIDLASGTLTVRVTPIY